jgi:uncharacterized protein with ATP-grasp and redox domains
MQPMEIRPECYGCLERLVDLTVGLATSDPALQEEARRAALDIIREESGAGAAIPAMIANRFHLVIQEFTGNPDPFAGRKAAETAYLAGMQERLASTYGEDLVSLLKLAAVGNAIDFFRPEDEVTRELLGQVDFGVSDLPRFRERLAGARGPILYLADNAGEQFFDRPLVTALRRWGWQVYYVVKGGPIQNDLTREDLEASGLGPAMEPVVDTGSRTVGLALAGASPEFRELYREARLILAKGMGHFETLSHSRDERLFFLLQAKCEPVARALGVVRRAFVFKRAV